MMKIPWNCYIKHLSGLSTRKLFNLIFLVDEFARYRVSFIGFDMLQSLSLYILKEMDWLGRMHLCLIFNSVRIKIIDWCVFMNFKTIHFIGMERPLWLIILLNIFILCRKIMFHFFFRVLFYELKIQIFKQNQKFNIKFYGRIS